MLNTLYAPISPLWLKPFPAVVMLTGVKCVGIYVHCNHAHNCQSASVGNMCAFPLTVVFGSHCFLSYCMQCLGYM